MKLLIADDHPIDAAFLERFVKTWDFQPVVVGDGKSALKALQSDESIKIAILDWHMPEMNGLEVCRILKSDPKRQFTYVLLVSSSDTNDDIVAGLESGADDYLTKPIESSILRSRLQYAKRILEVIPPSEWSKPEIPGYEIERVIGKGAFATVWKATRTKDALDVAIKLIRIDLATTTKLERFSREIEVLQQLEHRYISTIYDSQIDSRLGYYVMELITGGTLNEYVASKALKGIERLRIVKRVCEGLHHAHQQGIVHRDIKLSNVMMTEDGEPKLVDFGLSKSMFRAPRDSAFETTEGSVLGTPLFMAPEQARGEVNKLGPKSDLYSVGVILYMLLVKKHPCAVEGCSYKDIIQIIGEGKIRRPTQFNKRFNKELEQHLFRALAPNPDDRFESALQFAEVLDRFIRKRESVSESPAEAISRLR